MKKDYFTRFTSTLIVFVLMVFAHPVAAQSAAGGSNYLFIGLVVLAVVLAITAIVSVTDNFMQIEAQKQGVDTNKENFSIFPSFPELFKKPAPTFTEGAGYTKLNKGYDINIVGKATGDIKEASAVSRYAVLPKDFRTLSPIPRMQVAAGDEVQAGDVLFFDKKEERVKYVAPVSGEIVAINRGEKRAITEVVILADKEMKYKTFDVPSLDGLDRSDLVQFLLDSGAWTLINQRPYDIIPDPAAVPKNIFISTFDSAPLALDLNKAISGHGAAFQKGLDVLVALTEGSVYLGLNAAGSADEFKNATGVKKHWFDGAHPAGNVGVQIHHIAPINAGETIWTLDVQDVVVLGRLFATGKWDTRKAVALTGSELASPKYVSTFAGANIGDLLKDNLNEGNNRIIDGNVLTGKTSSTDSFLRNASNQITVIKEGDNYQLFGWLLPVKPKPSLSQTVPGLLRNSEVEVDTNTNGEHRAFVVSGQYEKVLPMDVYPQHLMKAIMAGDFERMEGLGIYELSEEDLALCEFACTSKQPLQRILRDGLDMMREQG